MNRFTQLENHQVSTALQHFNLRGMEYISAAAQVRHAALKTSEFEILQPEQELVMAEFLHRGANLTTEAAPYFSADRDGAKKGKPNMYAEARRMIEGYDAALLDKDLTEAEYLRFGFVRPDVQKLEMSLHHLHKMASRFTRNLFNSNVMMADIFGSGAKPIIIEKPAVGDKPAHKEVVLQISVPERALRTPSDKDMAVALTELHEVTTPQKNHLRGAPYRSILKIIDQVDPVFDRCVEQFGKWLKPGEEFYEQLTLTGARNAHRESLNSRAAELFNFDNRAPQYLQIGQRVR